MLNQSLLVGRIVDTPVIVKEEDESFTIVTLSVPRSFRNENGEYDNDVIPCKLWNSIAENTVEYCKQGDLIGVKGRVQSRVIENEDKKEYITEIIAEKVTFLSSKKNEDDE